MTYLSKIRRAFGGDLDVSNASRSRTADINHLHLDRAGLISAFDRETHRISDPDLFDSISEVRKPANWLSVNFEDDIADKAADEIHTAQAGAPRRRARGGIDHH